MREKICTVKEYDKIFTSDIGKKNFDEFVKFAKEFNITDGSDDIFKFIRLGYCNGDFVQMKNYVGLIQLPSGFRIEILPKIYNSENDSDVKKIFMKMLRSLRQFRGRQLNAANLYTSKMPLYEIFIRTYLEMLLTLIKRGLKSSYTLREDNLNCLKGKLLFNQQIRYNTVHREKFFVRFDEYNLDRPEHRLIKSALIKLRQKSQDTTNRQLIYQMLAEFDFIEPSANFVKDFSAIFIDRQNNEYKEIMRWTKIFLNNESVVSFAGQTNAQALLFPMEKLFETYVAHCLRQNLSGHEVRTQVREEYLFDTPQTFQLRPDILIEGLDKKFIADTKWKCLCNNPRKNYGISQADMYQMYAYAKKYDIGRVILLYPAVDFFSNEIISYGANDNVEIKIFFVDLLNMVSTIKRLENLLNTWH